MRGLIGSTLTYSCFIGSTINDPNPEPIQNSPAGTDPTRKGIVFLIISDLKKRTGYRIIFRNLVVYCMLLFLTNLLN